MAIGIFFTQYLIDRYFGDTDREARVMRFFHSLPGGARDPDYALSNRDLFTGKRDRVVVIFGFADNLQSCNDMAATFNKDETDHHAGTYACEAIDETR
jgi:hypothetical protein